MHDEEMIAAMVVEQAFAFHQPRRCRRRMRQCSNGDELDARYDAMAFSRQ
jgi:hypothetical protein